MEGFFLLFWIGMSFAVWIVGNAKGRFGFGYFILCWVISPILAAFLVCALPRKEKPEGRIRITR